MPSTDPITTLPDGSVQIGSTRIGGEQLTQLALALVQSGVLVRVLQGAGKGQDLTAYTTALVEADQKGAVPGLIQSLARVVRHVNSRAGMASVTGDDTAFTPEIKGLAEALEACAAVAHDFPTQSLNAAPDEGKLRDQAARLRAFSDLRDLYTTAAAKATANLGALAREAVGKVQLMAQVLEPALSNEDLAACARPLFTYRKDSVERAQATKLRLERHRAEVTSEVTAELYDKARSEARAEMRSKLDDRMAALLDGDE